MGAVWHVWKAGMGWGQEGCAGSPSPLPLGCSQPLLDATSGHQYFKKRGTKSF